jgi:hypothetical protein
MINAQSALIGFEAISAAGLVEAGVVHLFAMSALGENNRDAAA